MTPLASRRGRANRAKGQRFERWVVAELRQVGFADARRGLQAAGAVVADVEGVDRWWIECQSAKRPTPSAKLAQAVRDYLRAGGPQRTPVALVHRTGAPLDSTTATFQAALCSSSVVDGDWSETLLSSVEVTISFRDWLRAVLKDRDRNQRALEGEGQP